MPKAPAESIPLTDVYVCGVMEPEDPAAPLPKLRWSLFANQPPAAVVGMPAMGGAGDYHTICGPVLARTTRGTLLMFAEGRHDARDDFGNIDVILRHSTDWGATWSDIQVVHRNGDGQVGNTCPIVDHETGRIHLLTCTGVEDEMEILTGSSYREVWHSVSDDDGVTWSGRRNISAMARRDGWYWYATGPAAGIQIRSGRCRGRLVAPANHSYLLPDGGYEYACHALYSDDHGATWRIGAASEPGGNENQIAEAGDDLLIQDIRLQTNRTGCRAYRYSRDGGATLGHDAERPPPPLHPLSGQHHLPGATPQRHPQHPGGQQPGTGRAPPRAGPARAPGGTGVHRRRPHLAAAPGGGARLRRLLHPDRDRRRSRRYRVRPPSPAVVPHLLPGRLHVSGTGGSDGTGGRPPNNILVIMSDTRWVQTPNLDWLAAAGTVGNQDFVASRLRSVQQFAVGQGGPPELCRRMNRVIPEMTPEGHGCAVVKQQSHA